MKSASAKASTPSTTESDSRTGKSKTASKSSSLNGKSKKREPEFEIYKPMKLRKSKLKPAELEEFRELLIIKRRELMGDMVGLQNEIQSSQNSGGGGGSSSMPMHMADLGTDTWEQELALGLIENERNVIREIDQALGRIADGTYGICIATNKVISKTRLRAKPWAKYCIEYARRRELGLV